MVTSTALIALAFAASSPGVQLFSGRCAWYPADRTGTRGLIRADIDGDRRPDRVAVIEVGIPCRFALRVVLATGGPRSSHSAARRAAA